MISLAIGHRFKSLTASLFINLLLCSALLSQPRLFFSDNDFRTPQDLLRSSTLEGTDIDTLAINQGSPLAIEIDVVAGKMYWISSNDGRNTTIKRANLDGSNPEVIIDDLQGATDIALDTQNAKIYWSYRSGRYIRRANLDGSSIETFLTNLFTVSWLEVVPSEDKIYWLQNQTGEFMRANLDGSQKETLFTIDQTNCMMSIHIDPQQNKIYWANACNKMIQRANLDGSSIQDVVALTSFFTFTFYDFKLDLENGKIYWAEDARLRRCNLNGTGVETILNTDQGNYAIAIASQSRPAGSGKIYWTNDSDDRIRSCDFTGFNAKVIHLNNVYIDGWALAIDYKSNLLYWAGQGGTMGRSQLDGSDNTQIISDFIFPQGDIAVDPYGGKVYWTDFQQDIIQRANLNGSNIETILDRNDGIDNASGIALDLARKKLYWTISSQNGKIQRANLDGSRVETIIASGIEYPSFLKMDFANDKMYWTSNANKIQRANLDGSQREDLVTESLDTPDALALDLAAGKMYWAEIGTYNQPVGRIRRANLDGTGIEDVITDDIIRCKGIELFVAPPAPRLLAPAMSDTIPAENITFAWTISMRAASHHLQISSSAGFSEIIVDDTQIEEETFLLNNFKGGHYYWRIAAENTLGKSDWSAVGQFVVLAKPAAPLLASPSDSVGSIPLTPMLHWHSSATAASYRLQVSEREDFAFLSFNVSSADTSFQLTNLKSNSTYYWRVAAENQSGVSDWSEVWQFTTLLLPPNQPSLASPANGEIRVPTEAMLAWSAAPGASAYRLQLSIDSLFATAVLDSSAIDTTTLQSPRLDNKTTYYWRVSASNTSGVSEWSSTWHFTTIAAAPSVPVLLLPANGETGIPLSVTLSWRSASNAEEYQLQLAGDADFQTTRINSTGLTDTLFPISNLEADTDYYWRVQAFNGTESSGFSAPFHFKTTMATAISAGAGKLPATFHLYQNFPNPFNPSTMIRYQLPQAAHVQLRIFSMTGHEIRTLVAARRPAGYYTITWDGRDKNGNQVASGVFIYKLESEGYTAHKKLTLLR